MRSFRWSSFRKTSSWRASISVSGDSGSGVSLIGGGPVGEDNPRHLRAGYHLLSVDTARVNQCQTLENYRRFHVREAVPVVHVRQGKRFCKYRLCRRSRRRIIVQSPQAESQCMLVFRREHGENDRGLPLLSLHQRLALGGRRSRHGLREWHQATQGMSRVHGRKL
jgi:hypothetical protein